MMDDRELKKKKYVTSAFFYGFIVLCYLITEYEKAEDYEECGIIIEAINDYNEAHNMDIPTYFNDEAKEYFIKLFNHNNMSGETAIKNLPAYAEEVKKLVKE